MASNDDKKTTRAALHEVEIDVLYMTDVEYNAQTGKLTFKVADTGGKVSKPVYVSTKPLVGKGQGKLYVMTITQDGFVKSTRA